MYTSQEGVSQKKKKKKKKKIGLKGLSFLYTSDACLCATCWNSSKPEGMMEV